MREFGKLGTKMNNEENHKDGKFTLQRNIKLTNCKK